MKSLSFRRTLVAAAVATALGLAGDPADAAPYKGSFDPVDFSGEYIINVLPACLEQADGWYANTGICAATLLSANALVESTSPDTYNGTLIFAPPALSSSSDLFGLFVVDGKIDSFDTALLHHVSGDPDPSPDEFWIQFFSGNNPCYGECYGPIIDFVPTIAPPEKGVYLFMNDTFTPVATAEYLGPAVDIGAIPEPGTLSLILGALGVGWLARRRRNDKLPAPD